MEREAPQVMKRSVRDRQCIYCGQPAMHVDHVPPRYWRHVLTAMGLSGKVEFRTVPACANCNHILGKEPLFTVPERRTFIRNYLWRKHAKLISTPGWHQDELNELGYTLRSYVKGMQAKKMQILQRIGLLR